MRAMTFRSVLFPAPFGPTSPTRSPARMSSETPRSARIVRGTVRRGRSSPAAADFRLRCFSASTLNSTSTPLSVIRGSVAINRSARSLKQVSEPAVKTPRQRRRAYRQPDDQKADRLIVQSRRRARVQKRLPDDFQKVIERVEVNDPAERARAQQLRRPKHGRDVEQNLQPQRRDVRRVAKARVEVREDRDEQERDGAQQQHARQGPRDAPAEFDPEQQRDDGEGREARQHLESDAHEEPEDVNVRRDADLLDVAFRRYERAAAFDD